MPIPVQSNCDAHDTIANGQYGVLSGQCDTHNRRRTSNTTSPCRLLHIPVVLNDFHSRETTFHEAHFWLNGYVNKQNCRIWSEANSQVYVETPLHPEKRTVWCALWAGGILLQKRLRPQRYNKPQTLDHLEDNIRRVIADIRPQMLEKVIENWTPRLDYIRANSGSSMPEILFKM
ncbi:hypothetical protein TNCV_474261 [Trichonephila clavipes]|nr:hypothetical protein TNCV_474261 [Trichonephila clavipes]